MAERTIRVKLFRYYREVPDPRDPSGKRKVRRVYVARQGETLDLPSEDIARGESIGAFVNEAGDVPVETATIADMTVVELVEWLEETRPSAPATIAAAGDDPELAKRLLEAEESVTGRDARSTVEKGLQKIIDAAEEEEPDDDEVEGDTPDDEEAGA